MKNSIVIILLLILSAASFGQQTNSSPSLTKQDYLQKSKNQKTAAWILLGAGATCLAIAAPGNVSLDIVPVLVIGGGGMVVGSIPLFIASGKNKKKAMSVSFNNETVPQLQKSIFVKHRVSSLSLKINL